MIGSGSKWFRQRGSGTKRCCTAAVELETREEGALKVAVLACLDVGGVPSGGGSLPA